MPVPQGPIALRISGMPHQHALCFQSVADRTGCVISSRAVGKYATTLLIEGYATKGFHDKAKTCDWGPMAGFVLSDPRFTKRGTSREAMEAQTRDVHKALASHGGETPLYITDDRRKELELPSPAGLGCMRRAGGTINEMLYTAAPPSGSAMQFVLRRTMDGPGASGKQLWAVLYGVGEVQFSPQLSREPARSQTARLLPVMAMVDPDCPTSLRATYRAATTGDYDLFAVFPPVGQYRPGGIDRRMVAGSDMFRMSDMSAEHPDVGNITSRIWQIKNMLNTEVRAAGYSGGECVHHSDEAGRPYVSAIEYPIIAFVPAKAQPYIICNQGELREFLGLLGFRYYVTFNPGWHRQLGIAATPRGSFEA
ncbi:MAG TPA: anthrax toxin-like adenylyl cyclase domain-containing protein [Bryobacteraceae bacterium]|nr:anthrax toxin-like adenylyl cyclase domain-containing protein [Bryobacteraceae bacterium]